MKTFKPIEPRIFKEGCYLPEEIEYEKKFAEAATKAAYYNFKHPKTRRFKHVARREAIPIYQVDIKTKEIIAEFSTMGDAAKSIDMRPGDFSVMMKDRPIYTPVIIKHKWFIKQSHYKGWINK